MVILVIDQHDILAFKLIGETPVLVHPDCPMAFEVTFERVQSPDRNRHIIWTAGNIELPKL